MIGEVDLQTKLEPPFLGGDFGPESKNIWPHRIPRRHAAGPSWNGCHLCFWRFSPVCGEFSLRIGHFPFKT